MHAYSDEKNPQKLGGLLDMQKHGKMESAPASGSEVPAKKLAVPRHADAAKLAYAKLNQNENTNTAADKRVATHGHLTGMNVIIP